MIVNGPLRGKVVHVVYIDGYEIEFEVLNGYARLRTTLDGLEMEILRND